MKRVLVLKDWEWFDLNRHTPGETGIWENIEFVYDPPSICDYVVAVNRISATVTVHCPPENIWVIVQEPPVPEYNWLQEGFANFQRVYTPQVNLQGVRYIHTHGALPWWVGKSYDELKALPPPEKPHKLSWITSNTTGRSGHHQRMAFLEQIRKQVDFDLFGRGFQVVDDKWDALAPYRYALAVENHSGPYYWTEKLMDAFLCWSMPIYYGCTNITDYFPAESMIRIDITQPDEAIAIINEAIASDWWLQRRDAIAHARELILDHYQFFPFIAQQIRDWEQTHTPSQAQTIQLRKLHYMYPGHKRSHPKRNILHRMLSNLKRTLHNG